MIKTIYLDMDGVLTDFEKGCKNIGAIDEKTGRPIWPKLNKVGADWWADMPWMEGGQTFYNWLKDFCAENKIDLCILSSVGTNCWKAGYTGKIDWLNKNCKDIPTQNRYIVQSGPRMHACDAKAKFASDNTLLIDDFSKNVNAFIMKGGQAILYKDGHSAKEAISELV